MKKRIMKWLLVATAFVSVSCFGMQDYTYASDSYEVVYPEDSVLEDDEAIVDFANYKLKAYSEEFVIKVYEQQYEPLQIVKLVEMSDFFYDLEKATYSYYIDDGVINFIVDCKYIITEEQNYKLENTIDDVVESLNLDGKTEYQKVRIIHDYICNNVDYDFENLNNGTKYMPMYSAYAALIDGKAVCQGYASLFYRMCNEVGISSKIISGNGNGERHAWNIVKIGDEYFNIDTTWDGQEEETYYDYFLKTESDFLGHFRDSQYASQEFNAKYKMASSSWVDFETFTVHDKLNMDNTTEYKYKTINGTMVNNQAEGKIKILVFGDTKEYTNAALTAKSLANGNFDDVDIIFIDCYDNTLETVEEFDRKYVGGRFEIAYGDEWDIDRSLWVYVHDAIGPWDSIIPPLVVYIDEQNKVQHAEFQGYFSAEHVREIINTYIKGNTPVELSEDKLSIMCGDETNLNVLFYGTKKNAQFFSWSSLDSSIVSVDENGRVKGLKNGKTTITCKINDSVSLTCDIEVKKELSAVATASKNNIVVGDEITFISTAEGGAGIYTYSLIVKNESTGKWSRIKDNVSTNTFTWKAGSAGTRTFYIDVKDENGEVVRCDAIKVVTADKLSVTAKTDKTATIVGDKVRFTSSVKGGVGSYTYSLIVYNKTTKKWARIANNVTSDSFTWKAKSAGTREFYIDVKDSTGKVVRSKAITFVTEKPKVLSITATTTSSFATVGDKVTISGTATNGETPYTYSFVVKNEATGKWYRYKFSESSSLEWEATSAGKRLFYVEVKDNKGNVIRSKAVVVDVK